MGPLTRGDQLLASGPDRCEPPGQRYGIWAHFDSEFNFLQVEQAPWIQPDHFYQYVGEDGLAPGWRPPAMFLQRLQHLVSKCKAKGYAFTAFQDARDTMYIQVSWNGYCAITGQADTMKSRKWMISEHTVPQEVVRTCFVALEQAMRHEIEELFQYNGKRIYGPHIDVDALAEVADRIQCRPDANSVA